MPLTQMNVRIDARVKEAGDQVFEKIGLTPTQVVRRVWAYAAAHGEAPAVVREALDAPLARALDLDAEMRALVHEHDAGLIGAFRQKIAPGSMPVQETIDYKALREEAYAERLEHMGRA